MTESEIKGRLRKLLRKHIEGARDRVCLDPGDRFASLGANDLDMLELQLAVEDEWDVHIDDHEAEALQTVGDLERLVLGKLGIVADVAL